MSGEYAVIVVQRGKGGRCIVINHSKRGLFSFGERYFNHRLKMYPKGTVLNVTIRMSARGRRMIQDVKVKWLPALSFEVV